MSIKDFRITDPDSGDIKFTRTPKSFKGRWYHPDEYSLKVDYYGGGPKKIEQGYKNFHKLMQGFKSSR